MRISLRAGLIFVCSLFVICLPAFASDGHAKIRTVRVVSLWAEDVVATTAFYRDVIGIDMYTGPGHNTDPSKISHLRFTDRSLLVILKGKPFDVNAEKIVFPVLAIVVDDYDAVVARLEKLDIELRHSPADSPGKWVMFYDPAGNLIELVAPSRPRPDH